MVHSIEKVFALALMRIWLACLLGIVSASKPHGSLDHVHILPKLVDALNSDQIKRLNNQVNALGYSHVCGYWCEADVALLRNRVSEVVGVPPRKLGNVKLEVAAAFSVPESWTAAIIVNLGSAGQTFKARLFNPNGSEKNSAWPEDQFGTAIVMNAAARASFHGIVKVAIIPVLPSHRSFFSFYFGSELWNAFVATHCASKILGLDFFRSHTRHAVFWHTCIWTAIGSAALVILALPLLASPMLRMMDNWDVELGNDAHEVRKLHRPTPLTLPDEAHLKSHPACTLPSCPMVLSRTLSFEQLSCLA